MTGRWDFISAYRADFGVQRICRFLEVSRSGYYRWLAGAEARQSRWAGDDALVEEIREIHADHKGTYGVRRVHMASASATRKWKVISLRRFSRAAAVSTPVCDAASRARRTSSVSDPCCARCPYSGVADVHAHDLVSGDQPALDRLGERELATRPGDRLRPIPTDGATHLPHRYT
ncbi:IS3 family transposase [Streptomyces sp. NPDC021356]|uniref:IS3 family transposase n=1 Tax=Streptomyces sp. NPDC021356 TaxID=3154900 RepID=UPI0033EE1423